MHSDSFQSLRSFLLREVISPVPDSLQHGLDRDQWIRDNPSMEKMAQMKPAFREDGVVTAAISSPLTTGACACLLMSREKADELGKPYHLKYGAGVMAGYDPKRLLLTGISVRVR